MYTVPYGPFQGYPPAGQLSLENVLAEIRGVNQNVDHKFATMQVQLGGLQNEMQGLHADMSSIKEDMITRTEFEELKCRMDKFEANKDVSQSPEVKSLRIQLNRFDSANKSLTLSGFTNANVQQRIEFLEKILKDVAECPGHIQCEVLFTGKKGSRIPSKLCLMEFKNHADREQAFEFNIIQ